jgi:demethylmenaquinone methyltransferase/2-methoxy-6-polyprenyl-1,4-benzoquinol methylase
MISYILMKAFESAPQRYDWGLSLISLGHINKIRQQIVDKFIVPGEKVLDIGCGTGTLAVMMAAGGALVEGFDISRPMLDVAQQKVISANMEQKITLTALGVAEMETAFRDESYDKIVSNLVLSELSTDEQVYVLQQSRRLLKNRGLLVIGDEIVPLSSVNRWIYRLIRLPLAVLTFLLTQSITRSVKDLEDKIMGTGFQVVSAEKSFLGSFELIVAKKEERDELS